MRTHFQPLAFRHLHVYEHVCLLATHTRAHKYEPLSQGHLCLPWKRGGVLALRTQSVDSNNSCQSHWCALPPWLMTARTHADLCVPPLCWKEGLRNEEEAHCTIRSTGSTGSSCPVGASLCLCAE